MFKIFSNRNAGKPDEKQTLRGALFAIFKTASRDLSNPTPEVDVIVSYLEGKIQEKGIDSVVTLDPLPDKTTALCRETFSTVTLTAVIQQYWWFFNKITVHVTPNAVPDSPEEPQAA